MIRKLSHLCLITNDLDRQIAFYRDRMGLAVQFRFNDAKLGEFGVYLGCGDTTFIEIFDQAKTAVIWGGDGKALEAGSRYSHFCLEVTGLEDFCAKLKTDGVEVGPITEAMDFSRQAWLADPDGNRIELMEFTHRSLQIGPPGAVAHTSN